MSIPTLTLAIPSYGRFFPVDRLHEVIELARMAERAGVGSVVVPDHVVMSDQTQRYEWGEFPLPIDVPWLEPMTVLAAIAGATEHVRLATGILIAPLRPAALLAKIAATLDVLSRGRLDLGVGTGWQKEEFDAVGADYEQRGQLLNDAIAACRALWSESPTHFTSPTVTLEKIWSEPKPVQPGGVPIWFSGTLTKRNLDRLTRLGDGWIPIMNETLDGLTAGVARVKQAWSEAGRDPEKLRVRATLELERGSDGRPSLARTLAGAHDLGRRGATEAQLQMLAFVRKPEGVPAFFDELREVWAAVQADG
jgi:probable F420-dependent oxidoreductase